LEGEQKVMVSFGLQYWMHRRPNSASHQTLYGACIEQCSWADRLGFSTVMLAEHHCAASGYLPSPFVLGAAIASRTQHMRIRLSAVVAPLHNPVRLSEDMAVLDVISNGRLDVVLAGGYVAEEFEALGISLTERRDYMEEIVPFLRAAWTGETVNWRGRKARVTTQPIQRPGIPIWMGAASKPAARRAARHADVLDPAMESLFEVYFEELDRLGKPRPKLRSPYITVWVAEDPDEYWAKLGPHALYENNEYGRWYEESNTWNGATVVKDTDELRATNRYPVLTPEQLKAMIHSQERDVEIMFRPLCGGLDPKLAWESLELFRSKVLPAFSNQAI
jgi:alkanesulfonate monooxygenase SsuD/methylene tetrahydromethanopterin reductase-like flavin-dependent oxidoreductase (luciferase family)